MPRVLFCVALLLLVGACAFGNTIDYRKQPLSLSAKTEKSVAVGVDDKRPYVVSQEKTPEFVGLFRSGVGIPYGVHTDSGKPLAADFSASIVSALKANGVRVSEVPLGVSANGDRAIKALAGAATDRALLVTIVEWKSDKYLNSTLDYALRADVVDASGAVSASNTVQGSKVIGDNILHPASSLEQGAIGIAQQEMQDLLNDGKIVDALR